MRHILHLLPIRNLPQLHHQQIHIPLNHPRQILDRLRRKSGPKQPSDPRMLCVIPKDNMLIDIVAFKDWVHALIFRVLLASGL
jgi:hypothetical protein